MAVEWPYAATRKFSTRHTKGKINLIYSFGPRGCERENRERELYTEERYHVDKEKGREGVDV